MAAGNLLGRLLCGRACDVCGGWRPVLLSACLSQGLLLATFPWNGISFERYAVGCTLVTAFFPLQIVFTALFSCVVPTNHAHRSFTPLFTPLFTPPPDALPSIQ